MYDNKFYKYTTKRRITELGTIKNKKILNKFKKENDILTIKKELSTYNSKTCNYIGFMKYLSEKLEVNNRLFKHYEKPFMEKMNYRSYIKQNKK